MTNTDKEKPSTTIIIGAGIAGVSAADAARAADPAARIVLISGEHLLPYYRMNLTRYLAGEIDKNKLDLRKENWYSENRIQLMLRTRVTEIHPQQKMIKLDNGESLVYDKLILAMGAHPGMPPFKGSELPGIKTVRTLEDADEIIDACSAGGVDVVCIGGGLLGLEVAGAIAKQGAKVTVVEFLDWLLPRQLDEPASKILTRSIEDMGIHVITGAKTKAVLGSGHVEKVQLADGQELPADLVVVTTGISPNLELARQIGLKMNRGIIVDDQMRTSIEDIYAAGDLAEHNGRVYGLWMPSRSMGMVAGTMAAGEEAEFQGDPPSAKLKVLGMNVFSIGQFSPSEPQDLLLSEARDGQYASFLLREGVVIGSILLGNSSLAVKVKGVVDNKVDFSEKLGKMPTFAKMKKLIEEG